MHEHEAFPGTVSHFLYVLMSAIYSLKCHSKLYAITRSNTLYTSLSEHLCNNCMYAVYSSIACTLPSLGLPEFSAFTGKPNSTSKITWLPFPCMTFSVASQVTNAVVYVYPHSTATMHPL